jgi:hypothetical protein
VQNSCQLISFPPAADAPLKSRASAASSATPARPASACCVRSGPAGPPPDPPPLEPFLPPPPAFSDAFLAEAAPSPAASVGLPPVDPGLALSPLGG